ncbi:thioredoxin-dependent thiol peroxidase [Nakamurella antarctica]|uniref:thioredoxin-dependent peroxiredoxin n=1 Tax=Nakamurella antarctica TaxID=1902245 RepID=A0A3G8ZWG9_9ACTN|nr:thioredoxin-dependent thiol peroxidase [Nakamurella antarctica]AZI58336.1 thioredoxin-dependent thiol peroxidase [Nakamurella antarctica]
MTTQPIDVGDDAPAFSLPDSSNTEVSLSDFTGKKVVLYFYPAALTPGCTTQACDFTAARGVFDTSGYTVIGISPDAPAKLEAFRARENLDLLLLSDPERKVLSSYGAFGEKKNYGKTVMGVIRSTFVIDERGKVEKVWRNIKATGHVARLIKELGVGE